MAARRQIVQPDREGAALAGAIVALGSRWTAAGTSVFRPIGLGLMEARLLYALGRQPGLRSSVLAQHLSVDPAAISRALKALKLRGLVELDVKRRLALTSQGSALWPEIADLLDDRFRRMTKTFTAQELDLLRGFVERLHRNLLGRPPSAGDLDHPSARPSGIEEDQL